MSDASKAMYSSRQSSLLDMSRKAQNIYQELRDYAFDVRERLGIVFCQFCESDELDIKHIMLENREDSYSP